MGILSNIEKGSYKSIRTVVRPEKMDDHEKAYLSEKLQDEGRANVYPNDYDRNRPYAVSMRTKDKSQTGRGNRWQTHGVFTDIDVAAAVGTLCAIAYYGPKAILGEYDSEAAETHPEFIEWMADSRNRGIISKQPRQPRKTA